MLWVKSTAIVIKAHELCDEPHQLQGCDRQQAEHQVGINLGVAPHTNMPATEVILQVTVDAFS